MTLSEQALLHRTRRHFFSQCFVGLGNLALGGLLAADSRPGSQDLLAPKAPHFQPKVKRVVYLFMAGAPSQFETWLWRPKLAELDGKATPDSFLDGKRFAFMEQFTKERPKLLGPQRKFHRHGESGTWVSEIFPHMASIVDDLALVHSLKTENFNHAPAKMFLSTGSTRYGHPSMGSWITYGLGSESSNLPAFVVLRTGERNLMGGANIWGSGFLPTTYQGVEFLRSADPIPNLSSPPGFSPNSQQERVETIRDLNLARLAEVGDPEISTRIASYEMAHRMQTSGPELMDLSTESEATLEMYGATPGTSSFANNCLIARRLIERGTRFVQLYHTGWDHHGNRNNNLAEKLDEVALDVDQGCAALVTDLKQRGLLDDTLVI